MWPYVIGAAILLMVVGVPAAIWGPGYVRYRQELRVLADGTPATAIVLGLEDTGNRFNDTPEIIVRLRVTAEGRPPWDASVRRILSIAEAGYFATGRQIPVRYDPARPERIAIAP
jgi:hypothetical protein